MIHVLKKDNNISSERSDRPGLSPTGIQGLVPGARPGPPMGRGTPGITDHGPVSERDRRTLLKQTGVGHSPAHVPV